MVKSSEIGVKGVLITEDKIREKIKEMGAFLSSEYEGRPLLMVSVLKGAFVFMADIIREITIPCEIDFMSVSSYEKGLVSSGKVKIIKDLNIDITDYDVLIIEDILDTGVTLKAVKDILLSRDPKSLRICTLLDKPSRRTVDISADYTLFSIPDEFVVGYGLDCGEKYRNLPYIGIYDVDFKG